jgi:putative solute:sodium symporter small subunit
MNKSDNQRNYWRANLRVVGLLLTVWFMVGFVISIFFIDTFNTIKIGNVGLGFWFAQQGSIFVFVLLVLIYAVVMDFVDRRYDLGDKS